MTKPIFISGCPRSGTSILGFLIGKNRNIFSYLEPSGFYRYFNEIFLPYPIPFYLFKKFFANKMSPRILYSISSQEIPQQVNPEKYFSKKHLFKKMKIFDKCSKKIEYINVYHKFADIVLGDFARHCNKERWCVKHPGYLYLNINKIYHIHPDMKFIHIIRDGRDAISSIMDQKWAKSRPDKFTYSFNLWKNILDEGYQKSKVIPDKCLLTVKLEELLSTPDYTIKKICNFVEEEYDDYMKQYANEKFNKKSIGRWKKDLTKKQVDMIIQNGGYLLARYKYL